MRKGKVIRDPEWVDTAESGRHVYIYVLITFEFFLLAI